MNADISEARKHLDKAAMKLQAMCILHEDIISDASTVMTEIESAIAFLDGKTDDDNDDDDGESGSNDDVARGSPLEHDKTIDQSNTRFRTLDNNANPITRIKSRERRRSISYLLPSIDELIDDNEYSNDHSASLSSNADTKDADDNNENRTERKEKLSSSDWYLTREDSIRIRDVLSSSKTLDTGSFDSLIHEHVNEKRSVDEIDQSGLVAHLPLIDEEEQSELIRILPSRILEHPIQQKKSVAKDPFEYVNKKEHDDNASEKNHYDSRSMKQNDEDNASNNASIREYSVSYSDTGSLVALPLYGDNYDENEEEDDLSDTNIFEQYSPTDEDMFGNITIPLSIAPGECVPMKGFISGNLVIGGESDMRIFVFDNSVAEWDIGTFLVETSFPIESFSLSGHLPGRRISCSASWSASTGLSASIDASNGIGAITSAMMDMHVDPSNVILTSKRSNKSHRITESVEAVNASEAIGFLPVMDIDDADIGISLDGAVFMLIFASNESDIDVRWPQSAHVTDDGLRKLLIVISRELKRYAVQAPPGFVSAGKREMMPGYGDTILSISANGETGVRNVGVSQHGD